MSLFALTKKFYANKNFQTQSFTWGKSGKQGKQKEPRLIKKGHTSKYDPFTFLFTLFNAKNCNKV